MVKKIPQQLDKLKKLSKLNLRVDLPQVLQVNKPVTLGVAAVAVFVIVLGIVSAFSGGDNQKNAQQAAATKSAAMIAGAPGAAPVTAAGGGGGAAGFDASLKDLPQGYGDIEGIKKYVDLSGNATTLSSLKKDLEALKNRDAALQQQLSNLLHRPVGDLPSNDPQSQQARSSAMFFNGVAPQQDLSGLFKGGDAVAGGGGGASGLPGASGGGSGGTSNIMGGSDSSGGGSGAGGIVPNAIDFQAQRLSPDAQAAFYNKQQMQSQKLAVLKASDSPESVYDLHNMTYPVSPYEIQAGTIIPAVLISGINTSLAGTVVAQARFDVFDSVKGRFLLIPKGSRIVGEYDGRIAYGQRRVLITFNRVIRPDGSSILLGKPNAADLQGNAGIEGDVNNHWGKVMAAATLSTILSIGAGIAADSTGGGTQFIPGTGRKAGIGAASGISQTGNALTSRAMDVSPTITLNPGFQFNIIVRRDMVMTPYGK
jgi:type IV secretory pathway VirB10-like protein